MYFMWACIVEIMYISCTFDTAKREVAYAVAVEIFEEANVPFAKNILISFKL